MSSIRPFLPIIMLTISNVFMTFAWYGHLKYKSTALWVVILVSWGIAFLEYCFQVPANRIGHEYYSAAQLKTIQEIINILFEGYDVAVTDELPCYYCCDCSKERVEQAVISMGKAEIASMIEDNEPIEVVCDFCHTKYTFSPDELMNILTKGMVK